MGPNKVGQISELEVENLVHENMRFVTKLNFIGGSASRGRFQDVWARVTEGPRIARHLSRKSMFTADAL